MRNPATYTLAALCVGLLALGACSGSGGSADDTGSLPDVADLFWPESWDGEGLPPQPVCADGELRCGQDGSLEQCAQDRMSFVPLADCQDGNPCTDDSCANAQCVHTPASLCDDSDPCTADICLPWSGECVHEPAASGTGCCTADAGCDDGHECTLDLCDLASGACVNAPDVACVEFAFKMGSKGSGKGQLSGPKGMEVLDDGTVVVADSGNNRVVFLSSMGEQVREITEAFGLSLKAPGCVYQAPGSFLYICDAGNDRILLLDALLNPVAVWPPADYTKKFFFQPLDVVTDADGFSYVSDGAGEKFDEGNRLMKINDKGQAVKAKGKTGIAPGNFDLPSGIALNAAGSLVVTDQGNNRIQVFDRELERLGSFGKEGKALGQFNGPTDLSLAQGGKRIFIADMGNQRVQVLQSCQPDCTGKVCGDDGCGGPCGECPSFATCDAATGACEGFAGEGGAGCTDNTGAGVKGCSACGCEACVCKGEGVIDVTQFIFGGESDPYCCDTEWDGVCVFECVFVCGYECPLPEGPQKEPTFSGVFQWKAADQGNLAAPLKVVVKDDLLVYVLDTVKSAVYVYRLFLSPAE
jgi:DNA-binding beta-propeller fold protein YncE